MRKTLGFILCCLIPSRKIRESVRENFCVEGGKTKNKGKNNKIILIKNGKERVVRRVPGCDIYFRGDNNVIKLHQPLRRLHLCIKMYGDSNVEIKSSTFLDRRLRIRGMNHCNLYIGENLITNSECLMEFTENTDIYIGENSGTSDCVEIRTGDGHAIFDENNQRINMNKSVYIGNRVWVGRYAILLKGSRIMDDSIVGMRSLVTKPFEETGVIIAGCPAKVVKKGITWHL